MKKYFTKKKDTVYFIGDTLEIFLPDRYKSKGILKIGNKITTLGIFDMKINDKIDTGYYLPAMIKVVPSEVETTTIDNIKHTKLVLHKNDVFIENTNIVRNKGLAYTIFQEFVTLGNKPKFLNYDKSATMFDAVQNITGIDFRSNNIIFEIITAQLHRDKNDIMKPYRLTDMKQEPEVVAMRAVAHAAISTGGRLSGSFFNDTLDSTVVNKADEDSRLDSILRD